MIVIVEPGEAVVSVGDGARGPGVVVVRLTVCVVRKVALDLVGHHLLDSLLDAMYDHFIFCFYQRACFLNLPQPPDVAKPCRFVEHSSM